MTVSLGGIDVSRETFAALEAFSALVLKWTSRINLISANTQSDIWDRHVVDSLQIYRLAPPDYDLWLDIGSGGGFPGIVAAIVGKQQAEQARFHFVESDQRKATFLRTAIRELGLNAIVSADRIENIGSQQADVVSARALGSLSMLMPLIFAQMKQSGTALLHKGRQATDEIAIARQDWRFDLEEEPSLTDPSGRLLMIKRISRAV